MTPLHGFRVLELTHFLAGPYAGLVLADMGADVVKVEDPDHPDEARSMAPLDQNGESLYFRSLNWGKRSIGLRLAHPHGRAALLDICRRADVVLDNFRPGVLTKLGLDHEALSAVNPALITCSLTGFGETGPYTDRAGYDYTIQAQCGVMGLAGEPDGPPTKAGISYVDHAGGLAAALAVCATALERTRTGTGRHIDLGMMDVQMSMLTYLAAWSLNADVRPTRQSNSAHPSLVPAQNFRTADGHIALFVGNDRMWARLVDALADPELAADRFRTRELRLEHADDLRRRLQERLSQDTSRAWADRLAAVGVACAPVNGLAEALADPHAASRNLVDSVPFGHVRGPVLSLSARPAADAPLLGQHTAQVLRDCGYSQEQVAALAADGVLAAGGAGTGPAPPGRPRPTS